MPQPVRVIADSPISVGDVGRKLLELRRLPFISEMT